MTEIAIESTSAGTPGPTPPGGAPRPGGPAALDAAGRRQGVDPLFQVRTADIEPYTGLRYLSKLFRMIAVVLIVLLIAEVVTGLVTRGGEALSVVLSTLLAEVSRLIVLAGLLWGAGDLAILLIDVGHDVRAARILIGRQTSHLVHQPHDLPTTPADPGTEQRTTPRM